MRRKWLDSYEDGVSGRLTYPRITVDRMLRVTAERYPRHCAMIYQDHSWSYQELDTLASQAANFLASLGIGHGDRVGIHLPNTPQFVLAYLGILRLGAVAVPINPLYTGDDLAFIIADSGMRAIVIRHELAGVLELTGRPGLQVIVTDVKAPFSAADAYQAPDYALRLESELFRQPATDPPPSAGPEDPASLQYTGGTTGRSKGAVLTHRNLVANTLQFREFFKNVYQDGEGRVVCVIPLYHIYGLTTSMLMGVYSGSALLLLPRFDLNELMRAIDQYKPNLFMGVPAMYGAIAMREGHGYDLRSIRACMSGSAPLPPAVQERFEQITGGKLREGYGLSEASPAVSINPIYGRVKPGSVGVPLPDTEVRIIDPETGRDLNDPEDVGEILVRGPQVMTGYWRQPEETALALQDGWLHTGDLGRMDEDGYIYITDRLKDMIITGGLKVYPREVEDLLYTHPAVREAAVVGAPHPLRGEIPEAYVALKEGVVATEQELKKFCADHISRFKVPHRVEIVDALPRSSVGKILRRILRERATRRGQP